MDMRLRAEDTQTAQATGEAEFCFLLETDADTRTALLRYTNCMLFVTRIWGGEDTDTEQATVLAQVLR